MEKVYLVRKIAKRIYKFPLGVVVSAKRDLKTIKSVDFSDGAEFAKNLGMQFVEVSSVMRI